MDRLSALGGEALMATMQDAIQKVTTSYADFIVDDVVLTNTIGSVDEPDIQNTLQKVKQRLGEKGHAVDESTVRLSLDRLAQSYMIDAVRHNALQLSRNAKASLSSISDYITSEFAKLGIPMDGHVAMQARDAILVSCLLERGAKVSSTSSLVHGLIEVYVQAKTIPDLLNNLTLESYLYYLSEHVDWVKLAHPVTSTDQPIRPVQSGQSVGDTWSSVVSVLAKEGISPYTTNGTELDKLGQIAMNGALRNKFTEQIPVILEEVLSKNEVLSLLERHPDMVNDTDALSVEFSKVVVWHIKKLEHRLEEHVEQFGLDIKKHSTPQTPVLKNLDIELMDASITRAMQEAKTTLVERVVSAWINSLIQSQGEQLGDWHARAKYLHEHIDKWLAAITTELGKQELTPGALADSFEAPVGSKGQWPMRQTWSPLHDRVVKRLQDMGVDTRYLYSKEYPSPHGTTFPTTSTSLRSTGAGASSALPLDLGLSSRHYLFTLALTKSLSSISSGAGSLTPQFMGFVAQIITDIALPKNSTATTVRNLTMPRLLEIVAMTLDAIKGVNMHSDSELAFSFEMRNALKVFAQDHHLIVKKGALNKSLQLSNDEFAMVLLDHIRGAAASQGLDADLPDLRLDDLELAMIKQGLLEEDSQQYLVQRLIDIVKSPNLEVQEVSRMAGPHAAENLDLTPEFTQFVAKLVVEMVLPINSTRSTLRGLTMDRLLEKTALILDALKGSALSLDNELEFNLGVRNALEDFARDNHLVVQRGILNKHFQLTTDGFATALHEEIEAEATHQGLQAGLKYRLPYLKVDALSLELTRRGLLADQGVLAQRFTDLLRASNDLSVNTSKTSSPIGSENSDSSFSDSLLGILDIPENMPENVHGVGEVRHDGIANARFQLHALKVAVMNFGMLGFALFSS
ncbi:MAG: hypothetical protein ORN21_01680, partial [Methylophilaceae bacterium]|nr:hypothetical protein [Methylophilaceae bacterium]